MFKCHWIRDWSIVTVYAVDFMHDAFLIVVNNKFKWVSMKDFYPLEEGE